MFENDICDTKLNQMSKNDTNTEIFKFFSVFGQTKCHGLIRSHKSFQESNLKVVKPMTKWDILKITPLRIDCMIACLVPVIYPSCPLPVTPPSPTPPP